MNKTKLTISILCFSLLSIVSCKKEGCMDEYATNYEEKAKKDDPSSCTYAEYDVPTNYEFNGNDGLSSVSYSGQIMRKDMLGELVSHLKTANDTAGVNLNATAMRAMYNNTYTMWNDQDMVGSTKQLENKTATEAARTQFKTWMDEAAAKTSNGDKYHQSDAGLEWTQVIEKGMMCATLAFQAHGNYLAGIEEDDFTTIESGDNYTGAEHHWDEAYGYIFDEQIIPAQTKGRYWAKYMYSVAGDDEGPLNVLGIETAMYNAFKEGRAAVSAGNKRATVEQRDIIQNEIVKMVGGMAIHYLNDTKDYYADFVAGNVDQNKVNHYLSEAYAFIYGLQFVLPSFDSNGMIAGIDSDLVGYTANESAINADIETLRAAIGITAAQAAAL